MEEDSADGRFHAGENHQMWREETSEHRTAGRLQKEPKSSGGRHVTHHSHITERAESSRYVLWCYVFFLSKFDLHK